MNSFYTPAGIGKTTQPAVSGEATLIEIRPLFEPRHRNWESTTHQFRKDREALREQDPVGCSALELAEAMDRFLTWRPGSRR